MERLLNKRNLRRYAWKKAKMGKIDIIDKQMESLYTLLAAKENGGQED